MKKWMAVVGLVIVLTILSIFLFIPSKIVISKITAAGVTIGGEFRTLSSEDSWDKWWRDENGKVHEKAKPFIYNGTAFKLAIHENKAISILIEHHGLKMTSLLTLISISPDSTLAYWQSEIPGGINPLTRLVKYRQAVEIRKNMAAVMHIFKNYISVPGNIYDRKIYRQSINDTLLLSTRFKTSQYPTTPEIYQHLDILEQNVKKQKAIVTDFPMLHVNKLPDSTYETQIALPTSLWLHDDRNFFSRRMVKGYFIVSEVKGGLYSVNNAMAEMENYISDYNKTKIAIDFQFLVTNRLKESDTSKWVTRIYIPVVE